MYTIIKKLVIITCLVFLSYNILAQQKIDSLKIILRKCDVNTKIDVYYQLANLYLDLSPDSTFKYANIGFALIDANHGVNKKNDYLCLFGMWYGRTGKHKIALKYLQQALEGFKAEKDKHKIIIANSSIGIVYGQTSYYDKALSCFQLSLEISNEIKDTSQICNSLTNMGLVYHAMKDYKQALSKYDKALDLATKIDAKINIAHALNDISTTYNEMQDYEKAIKYQKKSLEIYQILNKKKYIGVVTADIGETYRQLKKYSLALKYFEDALQIAQDFNDDYFRAHISLNIADIYLDLKNYKKAKEFLDKAEKIAKENENRENLKGIYKSYSDYYSQIKDYKIALDYYKKFKDINDSIYSKESIDKIAELQVKFDIKEKEKENEILLQKTEIQQLAINKQIYLRNTFIYISIIITLLVIFVFFRYWLKKKANKILTEKNEFINKQKDELEEVYKTKDKLFAVITHDLKNPFNTILTLSNFVESNYYTMADDHKFSCIQSLKRSITNVSELLENLTDWLNAKGNKLILHKTNFNIKITIESVIKLYKAQAEQKLINLHTNSENNIIAFGNERLIKTVLRNLIDNAIKFTLEEGEIIVNAKIDNNNIVVSVSDNGVGIDEEDKAKIFNFDSHISTKGTRQEAGGGLGLILSKEFIDKNEGEIWFESIAGKGTTFYFTLKKGEFYEED